MPSIFPWVITFPHNLFRTSGVYTIVCNWENIPYITLFVRIISLELILTYESVNFRKCVGVKYSHSLIIIFADLIVSSSMLAKSLSAKYKIWSTSKLLAGLL